MNNWTGIGRLTKDPDYRESQVGDGSAFCRFTVAVDRRFKRDGQPSADFIPCVVFGKTAEFINKYFHKGDPIAVKGRIQTGKYTNKDGQTVYTTDIMVEEAEFVPRNTTGESASQDTRDASERRRTDDYINLPEDDGLPFA